MLHVNICAPHDIQPTICDSEPTYTNIEAGQGVIESTYAVVYADTGPSDAPKYDPLIAPTLPIPLNDFKHHVSSCHLDDDKEFSVQYTVCIHICIIIHI